MNSSSPVILDLSELGREILESKRKRDEAFDRSRKIQMELIKIRFVVEEAGAAAATTKKEEITQSLLRIQSSLAEATASTIIIAGDDGNNANRHRKFRVGNLNHRIEEWCRLVAFHHFLIGTTAGECNNIFPPSGLILLNDTNLVVTDEEYLSGAVMGLCQDLAHYAMGRATARDVHSVSMARDRVNQILDYLLRFDFRNGFLRRKYDGTKYALKSLETLLYELSVTGASLKKKKNDSGADNDDSGDKANDELTALHQRMDHRDALRERLIKKCRDGQKMAKQAIYALHRNDYQKSASLIKNCEECIINDLTPIVEEEPPLRSGSFTAVIEEYVEAKLFYVWLLGKEDDESPVSAAKGTLLLPNEFGPIQLQPEDYLGGLCDLTGEVGRFAVKRGTARDFDGVGLCLETNSVILKSILLLEQTPSSINKKMDQLRKSVHKIERMMYEMSLSQAAGMNVSTEIKDNDATAAAVEEDK